MAMKKTVVIDVVGLTPGFIGENTPFLREWSAGKRMLSIEPVLPAVTCSAQATYLTGKWPSEHGIVGNGWYFRTECEVKFWRQSNKLVQAPKIWEVMRQEAPDFTCANMFWWYNMYSTVDYSVTPRPNYLADGRKIPDVYSHPAGLRDRLQAKLGQFPLFNFWGPNTGIVSSRWIADAALEVDREYDPTLTLIYLPHLDYNPQRHGPGHDSVAKDLREIDAVCADLIRHYESKGAEVIVLSEYGITDAHRPVHLNRLFRKKGWLGIRREQTWELLDAGASRVFAVADHQVAHIYVNDRALLPEVKALLDNTEGVDLVLDEAGKREHHLDHPRAGELVAVADRDAWFTYYFWEDDARAPDYARTVDIHRKPGFDPVEMFTDPEIRLLYPTVAWKLLRKKLGFRMTMNVIPLDATLINGSHGRLTEQRAQRPLLISGQAALPEKETIAATEVFGIIQDCLRGY